MWFCDPAFGFEKYLIPEAAQEMYIYADFSFIQ